MLDINQPNTLPFSVQLFAFFVVVSKVFLFSLLFVIGGRDTWVGMFWFLQIIFALPLGLYSVLQVRSVSFLFDNNTITIHSGIFSKNSIVIPYNKLESISVTQGVLKRVFGLASLQLWTASPSQLNFSSKGKNDHNPDGLLILPVIQAEALKNFFSSQLVRDTSNSIPLSA